MPRRYRPPKRRVKPDVRYNSVMVAQFINSIMKKGKKSTATRVMYDALDIVQDRMKRPPLEVLEEAMRNVSPVLEVKPRRVGGATYQVPVEIRPSRRVTLAICWLIEGAGQRKEKTMGQRLANEILDAKDNRGVAIRKRDDMRRMAQANQAFAHFHWKDNN